MINPASRHAFILVTKYVSRNSVTPLLQPIEKHTCCDITEETVMPIYAVF